MNDEAAVIQQLRDYYKAFSTLDLRTVLPYFSEPAMLIGRPGIVAATTSAALAAILDPVINDFRGRGYGWSELDLERVDMMGATAASATGIAKRYKAGGEFLDEARITYVLQKSEAGWKIAVMVLH
jgi:ketosteroid isomerase-like protein